MKSKTKILITFLLNFFFSIFEFVGGIFTGSIAIISDAVHDFGDSFSIGTSFLLEKKSNKQPDEKYTYGYARFSVLGSVVTTLVLLVGSCIVVYNAILRIINPVEINYNAVIIFAVVGFCVNLFATFLTGHGKSLNQKAINLHMLEDVLGWLIVLIGAIVMRFTDISLIDPIISIITALFIFYMALKNMKESIIVFLEKIPYGISIDQIKEHVLEIEGVLDVHHIHVWSLDGQNNYATMHVVTENFSHEIKYEIKHELLEHGIGHVTLELEAPTEHCHNKECHVELEHSHHHHHHH